MTKICEIILKREEFKYSTPIDLDMVYYNINISEEAIKQCNIILPCRKYQYKRLPMGFSDSLEMFLEKMNEMFSGFEFIWAYIDDLLIITKGDWYNHLEKFQLKIQKLKDNGIKFNIKK